MTKQSKKKLTLDRQAGYQIIVPGHLDTGWSDWTEKLTVVVNKDHNGLPVTTLTGVFDQAALQGLLRRLYMLGLPLISVSCTDLL